MDTQITNDQNILGQFRVWKANEVAFVGRLKGMKLLVWQSWELNVTGGEIYLRERPKQKTAAHGPQPLLAYGSLQLKHYREEWELGERRL